MTPDSIEQFQTQPIPKFAREDPISKVFWVPGDLLTGNDYNPNHQAPIEHELLATSILEDGWTAPIHIRTDGEIVDGFHRHHLSQTDKRLIEKYHGFVPVTLAPPDKTRAEQMLATIRHNRARGEHGVRPMASIVKELIDVQGMTVSDLVKRLGMEDEEVERLYDSAGQPERIGGASGDFKKGWVPADQHVVIKK